MFDKILFDRNAFDRSVSSSGVSAAFIGTGKIDMRLTVVTPVTGRPLNGSGDFKPGIVMLRNVGLGMTGGGGLGATPIVLQRNTVANIEGSGSVELDIVVKTPITAKIGGESTMVVSNRMFLYQNMRAQISGGGVVKNDLIVATALAPFKFNGAGVISTNVDLQLPLTVVSNGSSAFTLRRLGALNENAIELIGIDLMPGESVTIDTDLLQVLLGAKEDVSSVTTDSVFFELNPGQNDITVLTDADDTIDVVAIWQNRWL